MSEVLIRDNGEKENDFNGESGGKGGLEEREYDGDDGAGNELEEEHQSMGTPSLAMVVLKENSIITSNIIGGVF